MQFDLRTGAATELFTCQSLRPDQDLPFFDLSAIATDPRNCYQFAVAGIDEYARVYDIRQYRRNGSSNFGLPADYFCPKHLIGGQVGITSLAFSHQSELLATYFHEFIYLFGKDMGLGPVPNISPPKSIDSVSDVVNFDHIAPESSLDNNTYIKASPQVYKGHNSSKGMIGGNFFGPGSEYVVSGSDCGRILIWRKRGGELLRVIEDDQPGLGVDCVEPHPNTTVLASSGIRGDINLWIPKAIEKATLDSY